MALAPRRNPLITEQALALLDGFIAGCPSFNAWFVKGNAHRMLGQWNEALEAYEQAHGMAGKPELGFVAQAYGALMQHRLGRTCEASRLFQYLGAGSEGSTKNRGAIRQRAVQFHPNCRRPSVLGTTARTSP